MRRLRHWAATHPGTRRTTNEDAYLCRPEIGLFAVADGVGGRSGGRFASEEVMRLLGEIPEAVGPGELLGAVRAQLRSAHGRLSAMAGSAGRDAPATTVVALMFSGDHMACVWAGDSRAYVSRDGQLTRMTSDHSVVADMVREGKITEAEADLRPDGNVITRALGAAPAGDVLDKVIVAVEPDDRFLLCSDGLSKALSPEAIGAGLLAHNPATALLEAALSAHAADNVTVLVVQA